MNKVEVLLANGTRKVYEYAADSSSGYEGYKAFSASMKGNVYEYALTGSKIYFRDWSYTGSEVSYQQTITAKYKESTQLFGSNLVDGNSYFFAVNEDDDEYTVVRASELRDDAELKASNTALVKKNGLSTVVFGVVTNLGSTQGTSQYAFIRSDVHQGIVDGKIVDMVDITLSDGTEVNDAVIKEGTVNKGDILKVTPVDDEYKFESAAGKLAEGKLTGEGNSNYLPVDITSKGSNVNNLGEQVFNVTADTQYFYVDTDDKALTDEFDSLEGKTVKLSVDKDGNVVAVYILSTFQGTKAVYDSGAVSAESLTPATNKVSVGGQDISVAAGDGIDEFVTKLEGSSLNSTWGFTKGDDKVTFTAKTPGAGTVLTGGTEVTAGEDAVAAVYESPEVEDPIASDGELTICGVAVQINDVSTTNSTLPAQLDAWITGATSIFADWNLTKNTGENAIVFTAKTEGAVGGDGPDTAPTDATATTEGKDAVAAVYELTGIDAKIEAATTSSATLSIGGFSATVTKNDLDGQLAQFIEQYNGNSSNEYVASLNDEKDGIKFTAKNPGAVGGKGPSSAPDSTTEVVKGEDAK